MVFYPKTAPHTFHIRITRSIFRSVDLINEQRFLITNDFMTKQDFETLTSVNVVV